MYGDVVVVAAESSVHDLHISMNVPDVDGNDRYYPNEGNDGDIRYREGSRPWISIQPNALNCDPAKMTNYVRKR